MFFFYIYFIEYDYLVLKMFFNFLNIPRNKQIKLPNSLSTTVKDA